MKLLQELKGFNMLKGVYINGYIDAESYTLISDNIQYTPDFADLEDLRSSITRVFSERLRSLWVFVDEDLLKKGFIDFEPLRAVPTSSKRILVITPNSCFHTDTTAPTYPLAKEIAWGDHLALHYVEAGRYKELYD